MTNNTFKHTENLPVATATRRTALALLCLLPVALAAGCGGGGGGGGGGAATVTGRILLVSTAQPPDPAATVTVGGKSATTAIDGTFVIQGASEKATTMTVAATGVRSLTQVIPALAAGATTDLGNVYLLMLTDQMTLPDGTVVPATYTANVSGKVASADTGAAISGADVRVNGMRTTSAADGTFALSAMPAGLGRGSAQIGVLRATGYEDKPLVLDLELETGANDLGTILMSAPVGGIPGSPNTIAGTVTLQGVASAANVVVGLVDGGGSEVATVVTAADGKYGFWVAKGSYTLRFTAPGFAMKTAAAEVLRLDRVVTVNVTLTP